MKIGEGGRVSAPWKKNHGALTRPRSPFAYSRLLYRFTGRPKRGAGGGFGPSAAFTRGSNDWKPSIRSSSMSRFVVGLDGGQQRPLLRRHEGDGHAVLAHAAGAADAVDVGSRYLPADRS